MVTPILDLGTETVLFSFGGGGLLGIMAGMAFKRIVKLAAIIIGVFVLVLAYLSYKGWITANWNIIEDQTRSAAFNASQQVMNVINGTASKFMTHPSLAHTETTPIAATLGFVGGFALGIKH